jgi:raffinose/stachyose/melibiose transport system substrate-binding protein
MFIAGGGKMDRRQFLVITGGAAAVAVLPWQSLAQAQAPITWWMESSTPEQQDMIERLLVKPFEAANPDFDVQVDYRAGALDSQLKVALLAGTGPDVVYSVQPAYTGVMARAGQLLPLDTYAKQYGWADKVSKLFLELGTFDGKLYALPKTYETMGLWYNKTLFDQNGWAAPKTISELETIADAVKAMGMVPFGAGNADFRGASSWYVNLVLNSVAGPDNLYKAIVGEMPFNSPPFVKAIETLSRWWQNGYFGPNYFSLTIEQAFAQVAEGKAAMSPEGTWCFQYISSYFPQNKVEPGFVAFPSAEGVPYPVYLIGIGSSFSIAATSKVADGTARFFDSMLTDEFYSAMNSEWQGNWNMPLKDLSGVKLSDNVIPLYGEAMKELAAAVASDGYGYSTWTFFPPASDGYLTDGIEQVWLGQQTVEGFLTELDRVFSQERSEGKVPAIPPRT